MRLPEHAPVKWAAETYRVALPTLYRWLDRGTVRGARSRLGRLVHLGSLEDHLRHTRST